MAAMKPFIVLESTAPQLWDKENLTTTKHRANSKNQFDTKLYLEFLDDQRGDIVHNNLRCHVVPLFDHGWQQMMFSYKRSVALPL